MKSLEGDEAWAAAAMQETARARAEVRKFIG
jgi:hypothetical protein